MRFFNTAGPVNPNDHYCLSPLERFDLYEINMLIAQKKYFIIHAPRQTGKTSYLLALMDYLNKEGQYKALYFNVEIAQAARENVKSAMHAILSEMAHRARLFLKDTFLLDHMVEWKQNYDANILLNVAFSMWTEASDKPLVLFIDEIDTLIGDSLIAVLRQLRAGYDKRPMAFPQSVILCGVRDVRDYRMHTAEGKPLVTGGSAFNIKSKSLRLGNFNQQEVEVLLHEHTTETGQIFEPDAIELIWTLTNGQPWLINALANEVCFRTKANRNRSIPITARMIDTAKENLILRRETHLDQLVDKLREERVRRVIAPMLDGTDLSRHVSPDNIQYVIDLGLIHRTNRGLQITNPIYQEVIPRELSYVVQLNLESHFQPAWYINDDGSLDMDKLLAAFQDFFRQHSEHWVERFDYKEAGPQLLLQAFLQRIVNSGGQIEREYGLGRDRTDLIIIWRYADHVQKAVVELKIRYGSLEKTINVGLEQTWRYMDKCGANVGHLIIFDRNENRSWDEKIFREERTHNETPITVWGM